MLVIALYEANTELSYVAPPVPVRSIYIYFLWDGAEANYIVTEFSCPDAEVYFWKSHKFKTGESSQGQGLLMPSVSM